ncbi:PilZ domain-containing protein [Acetivibrio cellulolyticus]|uniref:PilZ domain-containing protein n=1 Tax=Acetivibrio cellulolyticus TaxID=35830 RepID=UPI0001E2D51D|nr:PilZ domain-containing protein [Acetivibrio cellulolyticus]
MEDLKISDWIATDKDTFDLTKKEQDEIFKRGSVISIKHKSIFEPVLSVIQKVEGQNLYFRIPEIFLRNNVFKGDQVFCNVMQGQYEYIINGHICEIDINYPWLVEVASSQIHKVKNSRKSKRYLVNFQSKVFSNMLGKSVYAIIKNISMFGVSAVFKEDIDPECLVNVSVSASVNKGENLEFRAKVIRVIEKAGYNEYGLQIVEIDEHNKDILDKLIYRLECDETEYVLDSLK